MLLRLSVRRSVVNSLYRIALGCSFFGSLHFSIYIAYTFEKFADWKNKKKMLASRVYLW